MSVFDDVTRSFEAATMPERHRIDPLKEDNYDTWIIDARAGLRQKKLWTATQTPLPANASAATKEKHTDAADILVPIISSWIKIKLTEAEQNDGHLLWEKLKALYTPAKDQLFYTSARELFSLRLDSMESGSSLEDFITRIKVLHERIDFTKTEFTADHRTLLHADANTFPKLRLPQVLIKLKKVQS